MHVFLAAALSYPLLLESYSGPLHLHFSGCFESLCTKKCFPGSRQLISCLGTFCCRVMNGKGAKGLSWETRLALLQDRQQRLPRAVLVDGVGKGCPGHSRMLHCGYLVL